MDGTPVSAGLLRWCAGFMSQNDACEVHEDARRARKLGRWRAAGNKWNKRPGYLFGTICDSIERLTNSSEAIHKLIRHYYSNIENTHKQVQPPAIGSVHTRLGSFYFQ